MLNYNALKDKLLSDLNNITDTTQAMQKLGLSLQEYFLQNTDFKFSWIAFSSNGVPDPITTASGKFISLQILLYPSYTIDHDVAIKTLQNSLIVAFTGAFYTITDPGFSVSPGSFASSPLLQNLKINISNTTDRDIAMMDLSKSLIDWIKMQAPTQSVIGSHGIYIGSGNVIQIL
jgi:hypothetical protein